VDEKNRRGALKKPPSGEFRKVKNLIARSEKRLQGRRETNKREDGGKDKHPGEKGSNERLLANVRKLESIRPSA